MKPLTSVRKAASPSAARCSALPWPKGWSSSAGRPATRSAKKVSSAATRSVPECSASATSPSEPEARPVASLRATSAPAATTEKSALRCCGVMAKGSEATPMSRP
jgi:hypothetical protein